MQRLEVQKKKEAVHRPKKKKPRPWVLRYVLYIKWRKNQRLERKERFVSRVAALQSLESMQRNHGDDLLDWSIYEVTY